MARALKSWLVELDRVVHRVCYDGWDEIQFAMTGDKTIGRLLLGL